MEAIAKVRNLKGSPRKARLVIDLIRGRNVSQALAILKFTDKRAADPIEKVLRSAIANATYAAEQQNIAIDPDDLFIKTCFVDMGPHKNRSRMRPAPQGRAFREHRHYCHITVLVSNDKPQVEEFEKPRKKGKKLLAKEAGENNPKTAKKAIKADKVKEEKVVVVDPVAEMMDTKEVQVEAPTVEEKAGSVLPDEKPASEQTAFNEQSAENKGQAADAKDASSQRTVEINATQKADEAQLDENEQLERQ